MVRLDELEEKEVINIRDGARLGYVFDLEMDLACGKTCAFFVSWPAKFLDSEEGIRSIGFPGT